MAALDQVQAIPFLEIMLILGRQKGMKLKIRMPFGLCCGVSDSFGPSICVTSSCDNCFGLLRNLVDLAERSMSGEFPLGAGPAETASYGWPFYD